MVTVETNDKETHAFSDFTYTKNLSENTEKLFEAALDNYRSPLEGVSIIKKWKPMI